MYFVTILITVEIYKRAVVVVHFSLLMSYHDSSVVNYFNDYVFVRYDHVAVVVYFSLLIYFFRNAVVSSLYYNN